jgi:hypothetical protein
MKQLLFTLLFILSACSSAMAQDSEYYMKKAESYMREADYCSRQAEGHDREADYYNKRSSSASAGKWCWPWWLNWVNLHFRR